MDLVRRLFYGTLGAAALLLVVGCALAQVWQFGLLFVGLSGGWWWQQRRGMGWQTAVFVAYMAALALAGTAGVSAAWLLPAALAVLGAWDLDLFLQQTTTGRLENEELLVQAHLRMLGQTAIVVLLLGSVVLLVQIRLHFWLVFLLALVAVVVLGRMMRQLVDE